MVTTPAPPPRQGRMPSIPPTVYQRVFDLHAQGLGVFRIAAALEGMGVFTSRGSVDRLLRGLPPYAGAREGNNVG